MSVRPPLWNDCSWRVVLKKSFLGDERNFLGRRHAIPPAVSSLGGLRTPAPGVCRIRKPSQQRSERLKFCGER
jgi:hypothetical protein